MNPSKSLRKRFKELPCNRCGSREDVTVDHIIPKNFLKALGLLDDMKENYQPLCKKCNCIKGHVLDPLNPDTEVLLLRYINRWRALNIKPRVRRNYVFRNITVKSLVPETTFFVSSKKALESIYIKQTRAKV